MHHHQQNNCALSSSLRPVSRLHFVVISSVSRTGDGSTDPQPDALLHRDRILRLLPHSVVVVISSRSVSAQDLAPSRRLVMHGKAPENLMWNDKFVFRLTHELLHSETATVTVEIYTVSWFRDVLRVLISDLITPLIRTLQSNTKNTRFVALQVRRPSGTPQGILNMGISLLDSTMRSMPLKNYASRKQAKTNVQDSDEKNTNPGDDTLRKTRNCRMRKGN
ncbi:UNVERIFIED_CONTAM: hypothetical protein Sradi_1983400 [Sesamum radiatum]|uniref:C2 domain-containing protein n=1 Tax=Sesamum radiatum TaxID=300843 RepID=A0AAW2TIR1_SESRA